MKKGRGKEIKTKPRSQPVTVEKDKSEAVLIDYSAFKVGNEFFAIPLDLVTEIIHDIKIEEISHLSDYFCGVTRLRDITIPVIDMDRVLNHKHPTDRTSACLLIKGQDGLYGMLVDSDVDIIKTETVNIHPLPDCYSQEEAFILNGILVHDDNLYGILNPERIYSRSRTREV